MIKTLHANTSIRSFHPKASCKQMQHCRPTALNIVECYMLRPLAHPVACCCNVVAMLLGVVTPTFSHVQMDTTILSLAYYSLKTSNFIHIKAIIKADTSVKWTLGFVPLVSD